MLLEHYMKKEEDEELTAPNPYDTVFGKRISKRIKGSYIEKLSFPEFRDKVAWNHSFPEFIIDLLQYLTRFNLTEYLQAKALRDKEEHAREVFRQSIKKEEDPDLQARNESLLWE